jgi:hypothetical protein
LELLEPSQRLVVTLTVEADRIRPTPDDDTVDECGVFESP